MSFTSRCQWWAILAAILVAIAAAAVAWMACSSYRQQPVQLLAAAGGTAVAVEGHVLTLETVRERRPFLQIVHNFMSDEEINHVIHLSQKKHFQQSTTLDNTTGKDVPHPDRSSFTVFLDHAEDEIIQRIERRSATLARLPVDNVEPMQLTRYTKNQQYKPHYDYFEPGTAAFESDCRHGYLDKHGVEVANQRVMTIFVYLTEPSPQDKECAGGTVFPKCNYEVMPRKGSAALFHNYDDVGNVDPTALHGGVENRCDNFTKIGMNIWIRKLPWPGNNQKVKPKTYISEEPACIPCSSVNPGVRCLKV